MARLEDGGRNKIGERRRERGDKNKVTCRRQTWKGQKWRMKEKRWISKSFRTMEKQAGKEILKGERRCMMVKPIRKGIQVAGR